MAGSATVTTVASRPATNEPMIAAVSASCLRCASGVSVLRKLLRERCEQLEVLLEVADGQELVAHAVARAGADPLGLLRLLDQLGHQGSEARQVARVVQQPAVLAVHDLPLDAADPAGPPRPALPHRLGHGQAEAL